MFSGSSKIYVQFCWTCNCCSYPSEHIFCYSPCIVTAYHYCLSSPFLVCFRESFSFATGIWQNKVFDNYFLYFKFWNTVTNFSSWQSFSYLYKTLMTTVFVNKKLEAFIFANIVFQQILRAFFFRYFSGFFCRCLSPCQKCKLKKTFSEALLVSRSCCSSIKWPDEKLRKQSNYSRILNFAHFALHEVFNIFVNT